MAQAIGYRLLLTIPMAWVSSVVVFTMIRLVPGDPVLFMLGLQASPSLIAKTRHEIGLDQPIHIQYLQWIGGILHGNFGHDYESGQSISTLILNSLPVTGELIALSLGLAVIFGVLIGAVAAVGRGRAPDWVGQIISMVGISIPDFWLGIMLTLAFALILGLFPASGFVPMTDSVLVNLWHMILPSVALSAGLTAVLIRITRASMLDVLDQEFIRFARASGLTEWRVIFNHGLRNAAIPVVTVIGMQAGYLFGATIIIENVFSLPGLGRLILNSTLGHDYPVIQASVLVLTILFIVTNLSVDLVYLIIDPRLRSTAT